MAQVFRCPICLEVPKVPVSIPCGHSYCSTCIERYWDRYSREWDCPECRQTFRERPQIGRNIWLSEMVENFKNMELQNTSVPLSLAGPEDVACDACIDRKGKAVRSCLTCMVSYCETHIQLHYKSPAFNSHKLVPASKNLQEMTCPHHNLLRAVYCRTDKHLICCLCPFDEHKGHDIVLVKTEVQEKQAELGQRIQMMENEAWKLQQASLSFSHSTRLIIEECDKMFTNLIHSIERNRFELKELLRVQQETSAGQAMEVLKNLQKEISELKSKAAELEKLSQNEDHIHVLQRCQSLILQPMDSSASVTNTRSMFGSLVGKDGQIFKLLETTGHVKNMLQVACQGGFSRIYDTVRECPVKPKSCSSPIWGSRKQGRNSSSKLWSRNKGRISSSKRRSHKQGHNSCSKRGSHKQECNSNSKQAPRRQGRYPTSSKWGPRMQGLTLRNHHRIQRPSFK